MAPPATSPSKNAATFHAGKGLKILRPNPTDTLFWSAVETLKIYNCPGWRPTFQSFVDPILLHALSTPPPETSKYWKRAATHLLTRHEMSMVVRLRYVKGRQLSSWSFISDVQIFVHGRWQDLRTWLKKVPPSTLSLTGAKGYEALCAYHQLYANLNNFAFESLPEELQDVIILHALGPRMALQSKHVAGHGNMWTYKRSGDEVGKRWFEDKNATAVPPIGTAILLLGPKLRDQALRVLNEETTQVLPKYDMWAPPKMFPSFGRCLRKLELGLTHKGYLAFFQVRVPGFIARDGLQSLGPLYDTAPAAVLGTIPNLQDLALSFRSTEDAENRPWLAPYSGPSVGSAWYRAFDSKRLPCQKIIVDWIMTYAFPHISKIKSVRLIDFVKTESKSKWEEMLRKAYMSDTDYSDFIAQAKGMMAQMPDNACPPICLCPQLCENQKLTELDLLNDCKSICTDYPNCEDYCPEREKCRCHLEDLSAERFAAVCREYPFDFDDSAERTNRNLQH